MTSAALATAGGSSSSGGGNLTAAAAGGTGGDASDLVLKINGQAYDGWVSIKLTRGIDSMAGAFEVGYTDRWPGQPAQWALQTGFAASFEIAGVVVLTGWIDKLKPEESKDSQTLKAEGLGRTGDLVECSAMNQPGHWNGCTALKIISDLCSPFGINVTASGNVGAAFPHFALQQGEAVKDAIDRILQQRGLLPIETPTGDLDLASPSGATATGQLAIGVNLIKATAEHSSRDRFSLYVVKGSRQGNDQDNGKTVSQVTGQATDSTVTRYRPLMIMSEEQATGQSSTTRAQFAATVRAGRAQTGVLTRVGFYDDGGAVWAPNSLVSVDCPNEGLQGSLLINEVEILADRENVVSLIHVTRPEAYSLGEVKGAGLSRLATSTAGRGRKGSKGRGGGGGSQSTIGSLPST